jgi:hypothetical protein
VKRKEKKRKKFRNLEISTSIHIETNEAQQIYRQTTAQFDPGYIAAAAVKLTEQKSVLAFRWHWWSRRPSLQSSQGKLNGNSIAVLVYGFGQMLKDWR